MDTQALRILIRKKIRKKLDDGSLPHGSASTVWWSPGDGETCDACGVTITKGQLLIDGAARVGRGDWSVQFHVACFEVWNEERRTRKTA